MDEFKPNWELIETEYRAGIKSLRQIGAEHGITETAIRKRGKKGAWVRNLAVRIREKTDDLVRKEVVRNRVFANHEPSANQIEIENQIVEVNANLAKDVLLRHRSDIKRLRDVWNAHLEEIDATESLDLPKRVKVTKDLSDTLKNLIGLERESYGIDSRFEETEEKLIVFDATETARRVAFLLAQVDTKTIEATEAQQFTGIYHASRHEVSSSSNRTM